MKKTAFIFALLVSLSVFAQVKDTEVIESENYSITIPNTWKTTNDDGIVNIFPTNQIGAITISEYHDLELPKTETKKFILALYNSAEDEKNIKSGSGKKGFTEYLYEYFDEKENLFWITKVFQKNKDLYIISINCQKKYWNGNYMKVFNETFDSFKIKK
ncbi:hypothetical protein K0U91_00070 [Chryseobacterium chendengshani]|uniref:hypothetical protein n=1 Tax=Chryseobacterium sp. LJ668 TaxID=2864040 RepID=UPI001C68C55A|nr:hypothetical protein [Chryseobacterium sp. LJ668]MBW8523034.1 hypothetical protein [Chryseobacterium sp. LJ668]QYK16562.1 hypothetical protein K0U91_00070 [Chryseobacterium sp. LJ668]